MLGTNRGWIEDDEDRLVHTLFDNYNKIIRPVKNKKAAVPVSLGIALSQLIALVGSLLYSFLGLIEHHQMDILHNMSNTVIETKNVASIENRTVW